MTQQYTIAFKMLDIDGTGSIDQDELRDGLELIGKSVTDEELENLMEGAGVDASDGLDFPSFVTLMVKTTTMPASRTPTPFLATLRTHRCRAQAAISGCTTETSTLSTLAAPRSSFPAMDTIFGVLPWASGPSKPLRTRVTL